MDFLAETHNFKSFLRGLYGTPDRNTMLVIFIFNLKPKKRIPGRNRRSVALLIVLLADVSECERGRISVGRCRQVAIYNMPTLFPCLHLYPEVQQLIQIRLKVSVLWRSEERG